MQITPAASSYIPINNRISPNSTSNTKQPLNTQQSSQASPLNETSTTQKPPQVYARATESLSANEKQRLNTQSLIQEKQTKAHAIEKPFSSDEAREAELVEFNQQGFSASQTFLRIQAFDTEPPLIDTFA